MQGQVWPTPDAVTPDYLFISTKNEPESFPPASRIGVQTETKGPMFNPSHDTWRSSVTLIFVPHIHLETTADLQENADIPMILEALVKDLARYETISSPSIKAYHSLRHTWVIGEGGPAGFVHCTVSILSGRPLQLRQQISNGIATVLREQFHSALENGEAGLTVELREMDRETYIK